MPNSSGSIIGTGGARDIARVAFESIGRDVKTIKFLRVKVLSITREGIEIEIKALQEVPEGTQFSDVTPGQTPYALPQSEKKTTSAILPLSVYEFEDFDNLLTVIKKFKNKYKTNCDLFKYKKAYFLFFKEEIKEDLKMLLVEFGGINVWVEPAVLLKNATIMVEKDVFSKLLDL